MFFLAVFRPKKKKKKKEGVYSQSIAAFLRNAS